MHQRKRQAVIARFAALHDLALSNAQGRDIPRPTNCEPAGIEHQDSDANRPNLDDASMRKAGRGIDRITWRSNSIGEVSKCLLTSEQRHAPALMAKEAVYIIRIREGMSSSKCSVLLKVKVDVMIAGYKEKPALWQLNLGAKLADKFFRELVFLFFAAKSYIARHENHVRSLIGAIPGTNVLQHRLKDDVLLPPGLHSEVKI